MQDLSEGMSKGIETVIEQETFLTCAEFHY